MHDGNTSDWPSLAYIVQGMMNNNVMRGFSRSPYEMVFGTKRREGYVNNSLPPAILKLLTNENGERAIQNAGLLTDEKTVIELMLEAQDKPLIYEGEEDDVADNVVQQTKAQAKENHAARLASPGVPVPACVFREDHNPAALKKVKPGGMESSSPATVNPGVMESSARAPVNPPPPPPTAQVQSCYLSSTPLQSRLIASNPVPLRGGDVLSPPY
jgi:transcriptional regulator of met regulon